MMSRTPRLIAVLLAGALVLGACGDDDDAADDTTTTTTEAPADGGTDDEGTDDEGTDGGDDGSDDGGDGADDGGSTGFDPSQLAGIDDFCDLDDLGDESFDSLFTTDSEDPAERREAYDLLRAFYARAVMIAPSEIRGDVESMIRGIEPLFELLAEYDYDFMALYAASEADPAIATQLEAFEDPELQAAGDRVDAWVEANCD